MKLLAVIMVGVFVFTACEEDVSLTVPGDTYIDMGEEFDPLEGVKVSGADLEDVTVLWNPEFDNTLVNHYVASYSVNGETAQRNVYVQADKLAGDYVYQIPEFDSPDIPFTVSMGDEFNKLRMNEFIYPDIVVYVTIDGNVITMEEQEVKDNLFLSGTGKYDGEIHSLTEFNIIDRFGEDDIEEYKVIIRR